MSEAGERWESHIQPSEKSETLEVSIARPPRAFLSYSWEDDSHSNWVRSLATKLQESGVLIILDQWDLPLGSDQFYFMERSIEKSDFVIVVCTPTYAQRANGREGGVGFETRVITSEFAKKIESRKFIPVLRRGDWDSSAPLYLKSIHGVDLRSDPHSQSEFDKLVRTLHREPVRRPPVGPKPTFSSTSIQIPTTSKPLDPPREATQERPPNTLPWGEGDPGPCIDVVVMNSREVIEAGRNVGLEYPAPVKMKALLDTGAAVTVISKTFAKYCRLLQTGETEVRALGSLHRCGEHAGAITFPGTNLRPFDPIRIVSADFVQERHFAVLIGRDILRNWVITFEGRSRRVTIAD